MKLRDLPSVDELARDPRLAEAPHELAVTGGPCRARPRAHRDPGGRRSGRPRARRGRARSGAGVQATPRDQRNGCHRPHEPRTRAARRGRSRPGARGRARVLEPRVRPRRREARLPSGSHRLDPHAADRRGSGARRQQQRSRRAPRARRARGRARRPRLARRADRDRRRLPDPRRPHALGGAARRGGNDQPHADRRLRGRALGRDRRHSPRPPVEFPARRLHRAARPRGARTARSATRAPARRRSRLGRADRPRRRADRAGEPRPPARISSRSRATSCSAAPRPGSSSGGKTSSNGSGAIHSSVPSAPTSSRSPRSRQRSRCTSSRSARAARSPSCACSKSRSRPSATARSVLAELVGGEVEETVARVGGGALPLLELPSFACAVEEELGPRLRAGQPPVVGIVRDGRLLLDCRTVSDAEVEELAAAVASARTS